MTGFDELFADLDEELARQQRNLGTPIADAIPDFDDRPLEAATLADLDLDLALHTALQYSRKLGLREPMAGTLKVFLRELGLLIEADGVERPSIAAALLFGRQPQRFLPHAVVTATIDGKKRKVFTGNLLKQRSELLEWLEQPDVNPILKVKVRGKHEERRAFHERALIELCINLLVHRDYDDPRPATVEARGNNGISFQNPGRLPERVADRLTLDDRGRFEPVHELTSPRNRALCDVFYGMSVMERAGTGLSDVVKYAKEGDGDAIFSIPPGSEDFRAEILQPDASGRSAPVARERRPIGTYVINLMPFSLLPPTVSRVCVSGTMPAIAKKVPLEGVGTALVHSSELWSFTPAPLLHAVLKPVMTERNVRETHTDLLAADPDSARVLLWLLRKHFESHLHALRGQGLMIEPDRKSNRRAYFFGEKNGPRLMLYDTPHRRGVSREVVKQRGDSAARLVRERRDCIRDRPARFRVGRAREAVLYVHRSGRAHASAGVCKNGEGDPANEVRSQPKRRE